MRYSVVGLLVVGLLLAASAAADDAKDDAIKKDRERMEGTWRVTALTVNGNKAEDEDAQMITVVNGKDGTWSVRLEGKEIGKGTSVFDPTQKPKFIDFTPTEGEEAGEQFLGIYQLKENTRKLCFAPAGEDRPKQFSSTAENRHTLVVFERVESE
ncbi:TIGR03067 domain-containing protein [Roseimaritima sediminicola]|uniref:TIGR03067 domain-containing protein n=1 Tax=Roseimaritima sediminicola TaxID=2662066 RepID=UPI001298386C|nr:TIGR03067 domain-containing protein [Roseimaritima sediminicola]